MYFMKIIILFMSHQMGPIKWTDRPVGPLYWTHFQKIQLPQLADGTVLAACHIAQ